MSGARPHLRLIQTIENTLAHFYGFTLTASSAEFLLTETISESTERGCVLIHENKEHDTLEVGIRLRDEILAIVNSHDPLTQLSNHNLDAFWVIAEEVSHFHLICNRAHSARGVTHLELEIQGEIDKLLLAAGLLFEQHGDAHLLPLARKLFDESEIYSAGDLYHDANRYAADFWYRFLQQHEHNGSPIHDPKLRTLLRQSYISSLSDKLQYLDLKRAS